MKPKKQIIENADRRGVFHRVTRLLAAAYLLNSEANNIIDEAADTLSGHGLLLGELKRLHTDFIRCADRYFHEYSQLAGENGVITYFEDLEQFDNDFRQWAGIPAGWKPQTTEGGEV